MTLSRQLYLLLILILILVCTASLTISLKNYRHYLTRQLAGTAEDTATSLALSVSTSLAANDRATLQTMIDAVFDRGYYRMIRLEETSGKVLQERSMAVVVDSVPGWFIDLFPLETGEATAQVMNGWNQAGTIRVATHPGYAYDELWKNTGETLLGFLLSATIGGMLGSLLLRLILKPLQNVEKQALALCNREYLIQEKIPVTRELGQVVRAMNRMTAKVEQMFAEQATLTEQIQKELYVDPVTDLANRKQFDTRMSHLLSASDEFVEGTLLMIQLADFKGYNDRHGYAAGDRWLRRTAEILRESCGHRALITARLSGADFALLLPMEEGDENSRLAERILARLAQVIDWEESSRGIAHIGMTGIHFGESLNQVLARVDRALRQAQQAGPNAYRYIWPDRCQPIQSDRVAGASQWREQLQGYLDQEAFILEWQAVVDAREGAPYRHHELFLRVREPDGRLTPVGGLMAVADRVGLAQALDRRVIELALKLGERPGFERFPLAINLMPSSLDDPGFVEWLVGRLASRPLAPPLIFEVTEVGVVSYRKAVARFAERLKPYTAQLAIDQFGSQSSAFAYLREIPVAYVKLDGSYTRGIESHRENQTFVRALATMTRELDIPMVATFVETEAEAETLRAIPVEGLQGYHVGRPTLPNQGADG